MSGGGPGVHSMLVGQVTTCLFFLVLSYFSWNFKTHKQLFPLSCDASKLAGGSLFQSRSLELVEHVHPDPGLNFLDQKVVNMVIMYIPLQPLNGIGAKSTCGSNGQHSVASLQMV